MWFVFFNYRFKLIFHLETPGHLFLALLQIFLPFPWLLQQAASQASYVVPPEMKQLRKMSSATTQYSCHPEDLKYRLSQLPENCVCKHQVTSEPSPPASSNPKIAKQLPTSHCWPHCHLVLGIIEENVQNLSAYRSLLPEGKGSAGQEAIKGKLGSTSSCSTILLTVIMTACAKLIPVGKNILGHELG